MKKAFVSILIVLILICDPFTLLCESAIAKPNIVIVIDPGHGGPGITSETELGAKYNGVVEKDLTLITATAMKSELEQYGNVTVYMTRTTDQPMSLAARSSFAASVGADALISVHYNASSEHNFYGAEIFTSAFGQNYATGRGLGSCILSQLCANGAADKGCKTRLGNSGTDYYGIIRHGVNNNVPTIIVEHGYIDNNTDWTRIGNASVWQQLGIGDATAVAKYYGLQKGVLQADVAPTVNVAAPGGVVAPDLTPPQNVTVTIDTTSTADHTFTYTITASEPESRLMYCTYSIDGGLTYAPLSLWGNEKVHTETVKVPAGTSFNVLFRVYNNYELDTVSSPVTVTLTDNASDQAGKDAKLTDDASKLPNKDTSVTTAPAVAEGNEQQNRSAGSADNTGTAVNSRDAAEVISSTTEPLWGDQLQDAVAASADTKEHKKPEIPTIGIIAIIIGVVAAGVLLTLGGIVLIQEGKHKKRQIMRRKKIVKRH